MLEAIRRASGKLLIPYTVQPGEDPNNLQPYFIDAKGELHQVTSTYDPVTKSLASPQIRSILYYTPTKRV